MAELRFGPSAIAKHPIIHYRHTFSGNTCLKMDVASIVKGVKMTEFDFTPQVSTGGKNAQKVRLLLNT